MTAAQLEVAQRHCDAWQQQLGYAAPNMRFLQVRGAAAAQRWLLGMRGRGLVAKSSELHPVLLLVIGGCAARHYGICLWLRGCRNCCLCQRCQPVRCIRLAR
eukprot:GHRQ01038147.1.p2 GENE.GHRQ01038147.1~~GHRQ01038147.1.p2  ORF type:complete len:102 (-),score=20.69 GHRQ01038147.1:92-397(-)